MLCGGSTEDTTLAESIYNFECNKKFNVIYQNNFTNVYNIYLKTKLKVKSSPKFSTN